MKWWVAVVAMLLVVGCSKQEEAGYQPSFSDQQSVGGKEYVVGIHPLHNPKRLFEVYGPIVDYLNANVPDAHFRLEASRNYEEFDKKLDSGHFDFAMPNPYQTLRSLKHGYRIFGKMGDDDDFRGIILVRKDSGIREVSDLKGKAVSYPAATAVAAAMMPQYYLHTHGLDVNHDIENRFVGSQESSIMNVYRGHVAAAATWPVPWKTFSRDNPDIASQLEIKWQTKHLQNNGWVVRKDVPTQLADKVGAVLFGLNKSEQGRKMLENIPVSRFEPATEVTYQPMREFLELFSRTIRPLDL